MSASSTKTTKVELPKVELPKVESPLENILKKMAGMKPSEELTTAKQEALMACAINYGGAFICLIVLSITVYIASTDDNALTKNFITYMIFLILPMMVGVYLIMPAFKVKASATTLGINFFAFLVLIVSLYLFYQNKDPASMILLKYGIYVVAFLSIIIGLALLFKFSNRYVYNSRGWYGVIWQFIMLLPCLLIDFIEYVKSELKIAPNTVYVLLVFEAIVILLFLGIPKLISLRESSDAIIMLKKPAFLNTPLQIADYKALAFNEVKSSPFLEVMDYRHNYSVSFWAFLNPTGSVKLPIFKLGSKMESGGKPLVEYTRGKYVFTFTNVGKSPPSYEVVLPNQKWNYFTITYNDYNVDLFVNGNLEKTYELKSDAMPTYSPSDVVEIGYNSNEKYVGYKSKSTKYSGTLSGAICNVKYHKTVLTQREIATEYNLLMFHNPPVN